MARLNAVEFAAMNNPIRRAMQRFLELPTCESMLDDAGIDLRGKRLLDAGCGSGESTRLLAARFDPGRLVGFDLMPEQVDRARLRVPPGVELWTGDVTAIGLADASFDAAFVFGILHHVPAWRDALVELARVLAPGGVLLVEELEKRFVDKSDKYLFTSHPEESRFDWTTFRDGLAAAGFAILDERRLLIDSARAFLARRRA